MSEKKPIDKLTDMDPNNLVKLMRTGQVVPGAKYSSDEITQALTKLRELGIGDQSKISADITDRGAYIVEIEIPSQRMHIYTLAVNGKVVLDSLSNEANEDATVHGLDDIVYLLADAGLPIEEKTKRPRRESATTTPRPKYKNTKDDKEKLKPKKRLFDKSVIDYISNSSEQIVFGVLEQPIAAKDAEVIQGGALESLLGADLTHTVLQQGYRVRARSVLHFAAENKKRVASIRNERLHELLRDSNITEIVSDFIANYNGETLNEMLNVDKNKNVQEAKDFTNARLVYNWVESKQVEVPTHLVVEAITIAVNDAQKYAKQESLPIEDMISTSRWLAYARAADFVASDEFTVNEVTPLFQKEADTLAETTLAVSSKVVERMLDEENPKDLPYYRMVMKGLWMHGFVESPREDFDVGSASSLQVMYMDPSSHLIQRHSVYHPLLWNAFEDLVEQGEFDDGLNFKSARSHTVVGEKLYFHVKRQVRERTFTKLIGAALPLKEPTPGKSQETHLSRILRAYTHLHANEMEEYLAQHKK